MTDTPEVHLVVRAAWADVLDRTGDDQQDGGQTFVSVGGHSLAAARLVARLRRELGVDVPLSALLRDDPTMDDELRAALASHEIEMGEEWAGVEIRAS